MQVSNLIEATTIAQPPHREQDDNRIAVQVICDLLNQAARGENLAWALSSAMESIDSRSRNRRTVIDAELRDQLLVAVVRVHVFAVDYLGRWFDRWQIDSGMQALAGQVMLMAETREQTAARDPSRVLDIHGYARVFRNYVHNLSIAEEISQRAHKRRDDCIQQLLVRSIDRGIGEG